MKYLLTTGALALATFALGSIAGCNQQQPQQAPEQVIEKETTVVHDRPVIVRQDADHHEGDRQDGLRPGNRRDAPPPPADNPNNRPDNRPDNRR